MELAGVARLRPRNGQCRQQLLPWGSPVHGPTDVPRELRWGIEHPDVDDAGVSEFDSRIEVPVLLRDSNVQHAAFHRIVEVAELDDR